MTTMRTIFRRDYDAGTTLSVAAGGSGVSLVVYDRIDLHSAGAYVPLADLREMRDALSARIDELEARDARIVAAAGDLDLRAAQDVEGLRSA